MSFLGLATRKEVQAQIEQALKAKITDESWLLETARAQAWDMPDPQVYENQANTYRLSSWVSTAVEMVAQTAALARFSVFKTKDEEQEDIPNHPFEKLLAKPNPMESGAELIEATIAFRKLAGNSYLWLNVSNENAEPDEIWIIPPNRIMPVPDENLYLKGYAYDPGDGTEIPLETWEVLHWKRFNPFNRFVGLSAIEALAVAITGDVEASKWNTELFGKNNARLPGILSFKTMHNPGDWDKIKRNVLEASEKRQLMMLNGVGEGGVDWKQAAATQREMEFTIGRSFTRAEIWGSLAPGLESMINPNTNRANSETGERTFNNFAVYPMHFGLASKFNQQILLRYGDNLIGQFDDIRITDKAMKLSEQEAYAKTHAIDEIRAEYYGDKGIGDERGNLLLSEIKSSNPFGQEPKEPEAVEEEQKPPEQEKQEEDAEKSAYSQELDRFRRKALKRRGKVTTFESDIIPPDTLAEISERLPACKSADAINAVFAEYGDEDDAALVLRGLMLAVEAVKHERPS